MDSLDAFRKLSSGAKFDFQRFSNNAQTFQLVKQKNGNFGPVFCEPKRVADENEDPKAVAGTDRSEVNEENDLAEEIDETDDDSSVSEDENEEGFFTSQQEELQLLDSITAPGEPKELQATPQKKKKKRTKEKLLQLKREKINHVRKVNRIHTWGTDIPDPVETFEQMSTEYGLTSTLLSNIAASGYDIPTPIQMQAMPLMLHKRELLACAPTGSGKTAAFLIPIIHQLKGPRKKGFRAVIVAPTRELAKQTYRECLRLSEGSGLRTHFIHKVNMADKMFGRNSSQRFDILVTTPNRLVFLIKEEPPVISLKNTEWLIVDECDRLFEAGARGFREQLAVIYKECDTASVHRAMFSATFSWDVEEWCKLTLDNVVMVSIGERNSAVDIVHQELLFTGSEDGKLIAFRNLVHKGLQPPVLVFVQAKERAKELFNELIYDGINVDVIHADRTQAQRDNTVRCFRSGQIWVLICTELMGRGIDFKGVNLVVNYDFPQSAISYIHRIGRTGRAGRPGHAITFFTESDAVNLRTIAEVMRRSGCDVPEYILEMKKVNKEVKQQLAKRPPERNSISTTSLYDIEKKEKLKKKIKRLKLLKQQHRLPAGSENGSKRKSVENKVIKTEKRSAKSTQRDSTIKKRKYRDMNK